MKGTSLVEALVALLIMAVTGAAVVLLLAQIASLNNSAKLRSQATSYAQQGLEQVRSFSQSNGWAILAGKGPSRCYTDGTLVLTTTCIVSCGDGGGIEINPLASVTRSVKIVTNQGLGQVAVTSTICWLEKGIWNKTESLTYYYNY